MKQTLFIALILLFCGCSVTKSTKTIHPFNGDSVGCGNFIVYKLTEDNQAYVSVIVDVSSIELEERQAYGIGKTPLVNVAYKKFDSKIDQTLCTDIRFDKKPGLLVDEIAEEGLIELLVSDIELEKAKNDEPYKATVILKNVRFESLSIDYLRFEKINVGWLPG